MCRRLGEESDGKYFRDSSSDGSSDSDQDIDGSNYSGDKSLRVGPSREHHMQEGFSSDEGESGSSEGCLLFEYFARDQPYCREPLADKVVISLIFFSISYYRSFSFQLRNDFCCCFLHCIMLEFSQISDLAREVPELRTLRSCDLLPSSWLSVAWYHFV